MSLLTSLFSGVSGLKNHQSMMDVVGNNIANVNSLGFKSSRVTFSDTFSQSLRAGSNPIDGAGGTNPFQIGLGMKLHSIDRNWAQGTFERTGLMTDIALQGKGLFILSNQGQIMYSRAGAFSFDAEGNLVDPQTGAILQGKLANTEGVIPLGNNLEDIKLDLNLRIPATPTTEVTWGGNLSSGSPVTSTGEVAFSGTIDDATALPPEGITNSISIYDEYGNSYILKLTAVQNATNPDNYDIAYQLYQSDGITALAGTGTSGTLTPAEGAALDPATGLGNYTLPDIQIQSGDNSFGLASTLSGVQLDLSNITSGATSLSSMADGNEQLNLVTGTATIYDSLGNPHSVTLRFTKTDNSTRQWNWVAMLGDSNSGTLSANSGTISFNPDGSISSIQPPNPTITFTPANGANPQEIVLNFGDVNSFEGIIQTSSASAVSLVDQNGSSSASLSNLSIDQYGKITGIFSNGESRDLAQILLATFQNLGGLIAVGDNMYLRSANSGEPFVGEAGESTNTTVQSGALETSNVDLSEEFTKMIIAQRGFQANARVITVSDGLLQEITNLVR